MLSHTSHNSHTVVTSIINRYIKVERIAFRYWSAQNSGSGSLILMMNPLRETLSMSTPITYHLSPMTLRSQSNNQAASGQEYELKLTKLNRYHPHPHPHPHSSWCWCFLIDVSTVFISRTLYVCIKEPCSLTYVARAKSQYRPPSRWNHAVPLE
jgi:hypothetical protein